MRTSEFRTRLRDALGGEWPTPAPLDARVQSCEDLGDVRRELVSYEVEPGERVTSFVLVPAGATAAQPAPGVCIWHQHASQWERGKYEPAGVSGNPMHHSGVALARAGYVVLCPDAVGFGDRRSDRLEGMEFERWLFLKYIVRGQSLAWKNILDMRRALDYLESRAEVRADRLGCYGHSMGSTNAWMIGPWEPRLKAIVGNCCLPTYRAIEEQTVLHCFANFVPGIYPDWDVPDIVALTAPRALHLNFGELDRSSPIAYVNGAIASIATAYATIGCADRFTHFIEKGAGHVLTEAMWTRVMDHFDRHLKHP